MKVEAAQRRIKAFERKFDQPHLSLAAHAALPLALTPDLLYRIWANFQRDLDGKPCKIPWISVSDLLLSSLCEEVGYELYEMDDTIRHQLLQKLSQNQRQQVAAFLLEYVQADLKSRDSYYREFAQSQSWAAQAYLHPEKAIKLLATAIKTAYGENPDDLMRLTTLTELFAQDVPEFDKLVIYARAIGHAARNRIEKAMTEIIKLPIKFGQVHFKDGCKFQIPKNLFSAEVWYELGNRLVDSGSLEDAIGCYAQAVEIKPDYYEAWYSRGSALLGLGRYEEAIASYDKALEIKPDFHQAWHNRGVALGELGRTEEAIDSYDWALEIKPDNHLAWNNRGVALGKLGRIEEAIASYDRALEIQPDYHEAWLNRGSAAGNSSYSAPLQRSPLTLQYPQLNQRGFAGELASYHQGLTFCTQDQHPQGWGLLHREIGRAYYKRGRESLYAVDAGRSDFRTARKNYHQALQTLTRENYPVDYLELIQDLIRVYNALHNKDEAQAWRNEGLDVWSQLLNDPHKSSQQKRQLAIKFTRFARMRPDVLFEDNQPLAAFRAAEEQKNLYLTWILNRQNQHILSPTYDDIQQKLLNPTTALIHWYISDITLTTFLVLPGSPEPIPFTCQLEPLKRWLHNWDTTYEQYHKAKTSTDSTWRETLPQQLEDLKEILDINTILSHIPPENLDGKKGLPITSAKRSIRHLILIPHLDLHRLPLHTLFPDTFTFTTLPSAQVGIQKASSPTGDGVSAVADMKRGEGNTLLNIQNPNSTTEDGTPLPRMPHADIESAYIARCVPHARTLANNQATYEAVTHHLQTSNSTLFHFTGHASYNDKQPQRSALYLSQQERLSVQTLSQFNLSNYQLVCLSSSETGITGREAFENDYVGLSSAFLAQGVSHVIATLWTVESKASALFMMRFYEQRQQNHHLSDIVLFNQIQRWFKQVTYGELWQWYEAILAGLESNEGMIKPMLEAELNKRTTASPEERPYSHPYYWAAFTLSGT